MRRREFLMTGLLPTLAAGCTRSPSSFFAADEHILSFASLPTDFTKGRWPRIDLLSRDQFPDTEPHSLVILEPGPAPNAAFCDALFSVFQRYSAPPVALAPDEDSFAKIYWIDQRPDADLTRYHVASNLTRPDFVDLAQNCDGRRVRRCAAFFDLSESGGPWIMSIDPRARRAALLDFSGYPKEDYRTKVDTYPKDEYVKALLKWHRDVIQNNGFWKLPAREIASAALIMNFHPERNEGVIQVWIDDILYRYENGVVTQFWSPGPSSCTFARDFD